VPIEKQDRSAEMRASTTLKANGWERFRRREGGGLRWLYRKVRRRTRPGGLFPTPTAHRARLGTAKRVPARLGTAKPEPPRPRRLGTTPKKRRGWERLGTKKPLPNKGVPTFPTFPTFSANAGRQDPSERTGAHRANGNRLGTWERWEQAELASPTRWICERRP
jgi:hypothetical protein